MGFFVEIPLTREELGRIVTHTREEYEYNESCGESLYIGTREIKTITLTEDLCLLVWGDRAVAHCSYGGSLYSEIKRAIGKRLHYIDGEAIGGKE